MQQFRGLVRPASHTLLASLGATPQGLHRWQDCVRTARFVDCRGSVEQGDLLVAPALTNWLSTQSADAALGALHELQQWLSQRAQTSTDGAESTELPTLYVRRTATAVQAEVQARQNRLLAHLEGTWRAKDMAAVDEMVRKMLQSHTQGEPYTSVTESVYNGLVQALLPHDAAAALALAINPDLPPLHPRTAVALAALVDLHTPSAVLYFLEGVAAKDERVPAYRTCATQLAVRLRTAADAASADLVQSLRVCESFNVDPAVVHAADAGAIQRWVARRFPADLGPIELAPRILAIALQRQFMPRRVSMNALSAWCMSDLERVWLRHMVDPDADDAVDTAARAASVSLILREPRRNLVDNRLLHVYADHLAKGEIEVQHAEGGFAAFLEECGECHDPRERPSRLCFTVPAVASQPVLQTLRALAPRCGYWCTLLEHLPHRVRVRAAPFAELYVEVDLPREHECVAAAASQDAVSLPTLYEDDDLVVLDKPAGVATARHALSCTQLGDPTATDVVSLLLRHGHGELAALPRQGLVHRLDLDTSGCLVVAKTVAAVDGLRHQMGTGGAYAHRGKLYLALCLVLEPELSRVALHGTLIDPADPKVRTRYRVVRFFAAVRVALVECRLEQGKKHQVRRHLAAAGMPVLGDVVHGGAACCRPVLARVALHARSLHVVHPTRGHGLTVVAPVPADLQAALRALEAA